jgi:hypothetical protein
VVWLPIVPQVPSKRHITLLVSFSKVTSFLSPFSPKFFTYTVDQHQWLRWFTLSKLIDHACSFLFSLSKDTHGSLLFTSPPKKISFQRHTWQLIIHLPPKKIFFPKTRAMNYSFPK